MGVLGALIMINWAVYLSLHTFQIQRSCEPLIGDSTCIPCPDGETSSKFWQTINPFSNAGTQPENVTICPPPPPPPPRLLLTGSAVGSIVAVGAVIVGAPAFVAVGVGIAIGLATAKLLSANQ